MARRNPIPGNTNAGGSSTVAPSTATRGASSPTGAGRRRCGEVELEEARGAGGGGGAANVLFNCSTKACGRSWSQAFVLTCNYRQNQAARLLFFPRSSLAFHEPIVGKW